MVGGSAISSFCSGGDSERVERSCRRRGACAAGAASSARSPAVRAAPTLRSHAHCVDRCTRRPRLPRGSSTTSLLDLCLSEWRFASYRAALESFRYFLILSGKDVVRAPRSTIRFRRWISRPAPDQLRCRRVWPSPGPVAPAQCVRRCEVCAPALVRRLRHVYEPVSRFRNETFDHLLSCPATRGPSSSPTSEQVILTINVHFLTST